MEIIWGSFGSHLGIIRGSFRGHLAIIWASFWRHLEVIWRSFGRHLGVIWASFGGHLGNIWASFGGHLGVIWASTEVIQGPKNEPKKNRFVEPVKKIVSPEPPKSIFLTGSPGGVAGGRRFLLTGFKH